MAKEGKKMNTGNKYTSGIILLIILTIGIFIFTKNEGNAPTNDVTLSPSGNSITVESQAPGSTVTIKEALLLEKLWIVVYEESGGERGNILGAKRLGEREYFNVVVDVLRNTELGQRYHLAFHKDDGDDTFDFTKDILLENISYTFFAR